MLQTPIEPRLAWSDYVVVRLLRRWAAVRASEGKALPNLVGLAKEIGEPVEAAIALHSLFQLTEPASAARSNRNAAAAPS